MNFAGVDFVTTTACPPDKAYLISKPEIARMLGQIVASPAVEKKLAETGFKLNPEAISKLVNQTYQQLMETKVLNPTQKTYWIIVSDEGPSSVPAKHSTKESAEKEAQRLSNLKTGITFTVFEAKTSLFTPKTASVKTEYVGSEPFQYEYKYLYPTPKLGWL